ncbi:MAG: hypothetical protein ACTS43_01505 [Candidatus Hodgkinia cicadicola]
MKGPNVTSTCPPFTSDQIKLPFLTIPFKLCSIQLRTWKYAAHSTKFAKPPPSLIFIWKFNHFAFEIHLSIEFNLRSPAAPTLHKS